MAKSRRIVINGMLVALAIVLTRFFSIRLTILGVEGVRIGFGALPLLLAGFMFEPIDALFVGALSDIIGYSLSPMGPYIPYFTITAALKGWVPSFVHKHLFKADFGFWHVVISVAVGLIVNEVILVPYLLHTIFAMSYAFLLIPRLVAFPVYLFLYPFFLLLIVKRVGHHASKVLA